MKGNNTLYINLRNQYTNLTDFQIIYLELNDTITSFELKKKNIVDKCIYLRSMRANLYIYIYIFIMYMDEILLASNDLSLLYESNKFISYKFQMKDMEEATS